MTGDVAVTSGHSRRIFALRFHPQENHIFLTGGWDNSVKVRPCGAGLRVLGRGGQGGEGLGPAGAAGLPPVLGLGQADKEGGSACDQRAPHLWPRP